MSENPLVLVPDQKGDLFIAPVAKLAQFQERYEIFRTFVGSIMHKGTDYGVIPGTGDKPTLLKPGAEKLLTLFGLTLRLTLNFSIEDWTGADHGGEAFFYYRYNAIVERNGTFLASAMGSGNSWEGKYRYRMAEPVCPKCGKQAIKRSKYPPRNQPEAEPGWYCYGKIGGCGAEYAFGDKGITEQPRGQVPNPNPADLVNTLQKMAQKRAMVAAVLIAANASDYFTQDLEDTSGIGKDEPAVEGQFHDVTEPATQGKAEPEKKSTQANPPKNQATGAPAQKKGNPNDALKVEFGKLAYQLKMDYKDADAILKACSGDYTAAMQMMRETDQSEVNEKPGKVGTTLQDLENFFPGPDMDGTVVNGGQEEF